MEGFGSPGAFGKGSMTTTKITATATATDSKGKATLTLHGAANEWSETGKRAAKANYVVLHTNLTNSEGRSDIGWQWASLHETLAAAEKVAAADGKPGRGLVTRVWDTEVIAVTRAEVTTTKIATEAETEKVLAAVMMAFLPWIEEGMSGPFDGPFIGETEYGSPTIVWEGGPYEWVHLFPRGGTDEEFGFKIPDVSHLIPKGVWVEPANHYSTAVYKEVTS